jgi:HK97 family phage prohead protease
MKDKQIQRISKFNESTDFVIKQDEGAEESLIVEGYGTVWDVKDLVGDIFKRGAFVKTIQERVNNGKVLLMGVHQGWGGGTYEAIGIIKTLVEDEKGAYFTAEMYDSVLAKETYSKIKKSPNAFGSSVNFTPITYEVYTDPDKGNREARIFKEVALQEITITPTPCNPFTSVTAKSDEMLAEITQRLEIVENQIKSINIPSEIPAEPANINGNEKMESISTAKSETEITAEIEVKEQERLRKITLLKFEMEN